jgi:hypothetical protein
MESNRVRTFPDLDDEAFEATFEEELDSWHCADRLLCEECYGEFASAWPGIVATDGFQRKFLDLDTFYGGSRLQELYSREKFDQLCERLECHRCGGPIVNGFWAYTPPGFENEISEIAALAAHTPFLVLQHSLAQRILAIIEQIGVITEAATLTSPYFRARCYDGLRSREPIEFFPPPANQVREGRYNHNGQAVLYLGSDEHTCFCEVGAPAAGACISAMAIKCDMKVLDLCDIDRRLAYEDQDILESIAMSSLMAAPVKDDGWHRPEYVFTRFVADCARRVRFDGIRYPSSKSRGHNFVILAAAPSWDRVVCPSPAKDYLPVKTTRS